MKGGKSHLASTAEKAMMDFMVTVECCNRCAYDQQDSATISTKHEQREHPPDGKIGISYRCSLRLPHTKLSIEIYFLKGDLSGTGGLASISPEIR